VPRGIAAAGTGARVVLRRPLWEGGPAAAPPLSMGLLYDGTVPSPGPTPAPYTGLAGVTPSPPPPPPPPVSGMVARIAGRRTDAGAGVFTGVVIAARDGYTAWGGAGAAATAVAVDAAL